MTTRPGSGSNRRSGRTAPIGPHCGSFNVQSGIKHKTMTHRCRECDGRPMFSLKTSNIMEGSKLGYQAWAIANYLVTTSLKGVSSMKLHRDLEITQKTAWHLAHRLREVGRDMRLERRVGRNRYPDRECIEGPPPSDAVNEIDDFSRPDLFVTDPLDRSRKCPSAVTEFIHI